jgi:saccharopine dehydrogenase (NADP+, L-glutamate forming)
VYRGTLRYHGFSDMMYSFRCLGLLDPAPRSDVSATSTWRHLMGQLLNTTGPDAPIGRAVQSKLANVGLAAEVQERSMEAIQWLELLSDRPIEWKGNVMDTFCALLQEKLAMQPGDRDMVLLYHRFLVEHADKTQERITSTLLQYGNPAGYTAMAATVGYPTAISSQYILDGTYFDA